LINLPADVRVFILSNEMQNFGTATVFNQLLNDYRTTADASYRRDLAQALTKTKDAKQIATIVDAFEDADTIKPQDLRAWFAGVLANPAGQQAAWDWFRD
jgi:aminopeptidase N